MSFYVVELGIINFEEVAPMRTMKKVMVIVNELDDTFSTEEYEFPFDDQELSTGYHMKETVEEEVFEAGIIAIMEACDCDKEEAYEILQFNQTRSWLV